MKILHRSEKGPSCGQKVEPEAKSGVASSLDEPVAFNPTKVNCPECGKMFKEKSQMERHRVNEHERL